MNKLLLARAAAFALTMAGPAVAADMPLQAPPMAPFTWTSCYLGAHLGGGSARKDLTDPVQLVQDSFLGTGSTIGVTTASPAPSGVVVGGQIGCDYQFASTWVVGIEGAASGSTMKGRTTVQLPLGDPGDNALVTARADFIPSVTARVGYAIDRVLLYAKGGVAWAGDKYTVTGTFAGSGFGFEGLDMRTGWTAGGGVEWAFSLHWSASVEYDYYQFGHGNVLMSDSNNGFSGVVDAKQSVQVVKAGLNFHMWAW
jgi:outer membrane immunogenic protein